MGAEHRDWLSGVHLDVVGGSYRVGVQDLSTDAAVMTELFSPAGRDDPRAVVNRSSIPGCRYDVADAVLRDPRFLAPSIGPSDDLMFQTLGRWMPRVDGERHARLRARFAGLFTARRVERYRGLISDKVAQLLDQMEDASEVDLVADFASPLPHAVVCDVLGVPDELRGQFADDLAVIGRGFANQRHRSFVEDGNAAMARVLEALSGQLAVRESKPGTDVLSTIAQQGCTDNDERADVVANCLFFLIAGQFTTTVLLAAGADLLCRHRDQLAAVRSDPNLWPGAVEEMLRYLSPETLTGVYVSEDANVADIAFDGGSQLLVVYLGANHDPARFPEPDRFDIRRDASAHLAFSAGRHYCIGAPLVRLEAEIALSALFARFPGLNTGKPQWRGSAPIRQIESWPAEL